MKSISLKYFLRNQLESPCPKFNENLSDTLITWSKITDKGFFVKTDVERDLMLCRYLEQFSIEKSQMLSLINIPFDERNDELLNMWKRFVKRYVNNTLDLKKEIENIFLTNDLESLELDHKKFDLIFSFMKAIHFENEEEYQLVKDKKLDISMKIIELLKKQKTNFKRCSKCRKNYLGIIHMVFVKIVTPLQVEILIFMMIFLMIKIGFKILKNRQTFLKLVCF